MELETNEIGLAAGEVYQYLHQKGETTISELRREVTLGRGRVDQALGWLAREDKIQFIRDRRSTLVRLRER